NIQIRFTRTVVLAQGFDVGRLNYRILTLTGIAPGVAGVGNYGGDFNVVQLVAESRHGGAGMTVKHGENLVFHGTHDVFVAAVKSREGAWKALAVCLVASHAVGGIDFFAASNEFVFGPLFIGIVGGGSQRFLFARGPLFVVFLGNHVYHDGHEGVILAAKLGALATVGADFLGTEPCVAQETGHGVLLDAEFRNHPRVNNVVGGQDDAYFFVDRHDQRLVDFHEVQIGARRGAYDLIAGSGQVGQELDALCGAINVLVAPFPLVARNLDGQVGAGGVLHGNDGACCRQRHADDDQEGNDCPGNFNADVLVELRRNRAA